MIVFTTADQFSVVAPHTGVAEASDLGFPAGVWPDLLAVMRSSEKDSTGVLLERYGPIYRGQGEDRELGGYEYIQRRGGPMHITVFND